MDSNNVIRNKSNKTAISSTSKGCVNDEENIPSEIYLYVVECAR